MTALNNGKVSKYDEKVTSNQVSRKGDFHMDGKRKQTGCDSCTYYNYDEDYEEYVCDVNMDEDEYVRFMTDSHFRCPYYRNGDEYAVVRKQM